MFCLAQPFFLYCVSPLHAGSGSDLGVIDLPIQREKHTGFPKMESSGLKGGMRHALTQKLGNNPKNLSRITAAFGPEDGDLYAGALGFSDARLLLFPVKSLQGIFAWATCPTLLQRFRNELQICLDLAQENGPAANPEQQATPQNRQITAQNTAQAGIKKQILETAGLKKAMELLNNLLLSCPPTDLALAPPNSPLLLQYQNHTNQVIVLEEYAFPVEQRKDALTCWSKFTNWLCCQLFNSASPMANLMAEQTVLLPDDALRDFTELSTEVATRIKIDTSTGTVKKGGLFTEEYLPAESVLYALALASPLPGQSRESFFPANDKKTPAPSPEEPPCGLQDATAVLEFFFENVPKTVQLGGNATLGKGITRVCRLHQLPGEGKPDDANARN
ncbi:MAG: type III-B CRISPR module RAMP protein Cmr4 [Bacillota bacterium]